MASASPQDAFAQYDTYQSPSAGQVLATGLLGPCFVGWMLHLVFWGLVLSSAFSYVHSPLYKSDPRRTKVLLWSLVLLDFVATAVSFGQAFTYGTSQRRDTVTLLLGTSVLDALPYTLCGTTALLTQAALAWRASKFFKGLGRSKLRISFLVIVGVLSLAAWLASIGVTILYGLLFSGYSSTFLNTNVFVTSNLCASLWAFLSAAVDCIITVSLCFVLKHEIRGFNASTDDVVKQVILLSMKTGMTTSFFALTGAILGVAFPQDNLARGNILLSFILPLSSLYVLSFITTLSTRGANLRSTHTSFAPISLDRISVQHQRTTQVDDGEGRFWSKEQDEEARIAGRSEDQGMRPKLSPHERGPS